MSHTPITPGTVVKVPGTGPSHDPGRPHYYVVVTGACSKGDHMLVPICSVRGAHDPACLIDPSEHKSLSLKSYVYYGGANKQFGKNIRRRLDQGEIFPHPPVSDSLLQRIVDGLMASKFATPAMKKYVQAQTEPPEPAVEPDQAGEALGSSPASPASAPRTPPE